VTNDDGIVAVVNKIDLKSTEWQIETQLQAQNKLTNTITLNSISIINPEQVKDVKNTVAKAEQVTDPDAIAANLR